MAHKHSEGSPCECEKLKNAEREELREGLKKCVEAREAERREREAENAKRADEAEAEVKSLKKRLIAFQLATAVGVAVIGQEAFDKITAKMDAAQEMQEKITGGAAPVSDGGGKKPQAMDTIGQPFGGRPWQKPQRITIQEDRGNGDISGIFAGGKPKPSTDAPPAVPDVAVRQRSVGDEIARLATAADIPLAVPFAAVEDPYAVFLTPSTLPFDVYSTTLALGNNYGFGEYYGIGGGGAIAPSVPSPSPLTVFAVGGLMHNRRRA